MDYARVNDFVYVEVNGIGVVLAGMILLHTYMKVSAIGPNSLRYFRWMLTLSILSLCLDTGCFLLTGHTAAATVFAAHACNIAFFVSECFFGYVWVRYCTEVLYPRRRLSGIRNAILLLPAVFNAALAAASPWTGWVYALDASNNYVRGPLIGFSLAMLYCYWAISLFLLIKGKAYRNKGKATSFYRALLLFPLPTIAGTLLQMTCGGLSIGWVCTIFSLLLVFLNIQTSDGSVDGLTGLWTRIHMVSDLLQRLKDPRQTVFAMMIDIDGFKEINDTHGHVLGDKALICVAELLMQVFRKKDHVCRYGGDEFLVTGEINSEAELADMERRISEAVDKLNEESKLPFRISLCMGTAVKAKSADMTIDALINASDQQMYRKKQAKKQQSEKAGVGPFCAAADET